ncbi:MAG: ABC transporter substrate-binding protein [Alphaproteobacteria bacterium]|nr:ABC transporter substrate-binding protein [Alphaproteobacteria bacterium]
MRRRDLLALIGSTGIWPLAAGGQQPLPAIGFLSGASPTGPRQPDIDGLSQGLAEAGYIVGRDLEVEYRFAEAQFDRLPALAAELVSRRVALIATVTLPAAIAAKAARPTTPVVFVIGEDPVKAGLVASLNRPGDNATGISDFVNELIAKRLELLRQAAPGATSIGLLVNPDNPNAEPDAETASAAAAALGQTLVIMKATNDRELTAAFETLAQQRAGALAINIDPFLFRAQYQIVALAARYGLPAIYALRQFVDAGGLMSYSPNRLVSWHQAGAYAARILHGENPADLPVQRANKVELVINLKAAKALGLTLPQYLLARADEVIE